jgi:hypothetical protein
MEVGIEPTLSVAEHCAWWLAKSKRRRASRAMEGEILIVDEAFIGAPARNRTGIRGLEIRCSIHLSYGSIARTCVSGGYQKRRDRQDSNRRAPLGIEVTAAGRERAQEEGGVRFQIGRLRVFVGRLSAGSQLAEAGWHLITSIAGGLRKRARRARVAPRHSRRWRLSLAK